MNDGLNWEREGGEDEASVAGVLAEWLMDGGDGQGTDPTSAGCGSECGVDRDRQGAARQPAFRIAPRFAGVASLARALNRERMFTDDLTDNPTSILVAMMAVLAPEKCGGAAFRRRRLVSLERMRDEAVLTEAERVAALMQGTAEMEVEEMSYDDWFKPSRCPSVACPTLAAARNARLAGEREAAPSGGDLAGAPEIPDSEIPGSELPGYVRL